MATAYFPSLSDADLVSVEFLTPQGGTVSMSLLVDSGFTGQSAFVLPREAGNLVHASVPRSEAAGALRGMQDRGWVMCRVPPISFEGMMIAIFADLSLP